MKKCHFDIVSTGNYREESGDSSQVQVTMSLVNESWLVICLCTILVTSINHLFLLVFIVWRDNELNLKAYFSFIMKLLYPFLCWELKNVSWVCISLQNQKLTKFFTINTTWKCIMNGTPNKKISFQIIWHYMTYDEHLQYHRNHIFWCNG